MRGERVAGEDEEGRLDGVSESLLHRLGAVRMLMVGQYVEWYWGIVIAAVVGM